MAKSKGSEPAPGSFDTSEAVEVTTTMEEATEAGFLGASFDDADYTVAGVTGEAQSAPSAALKKPPQVMKDEPKGDSK